MNRLGNTDVQQILTNGIDYGIVLLPVLGVLGIIIGFMALMGGRMTSLLWNGPERCLGMAHLC